MGVRCLLSLCSEAGFVQLLSNCIGYFVAPFDSSFSFWVIVTDSLNGQICFHLSLPGQFPNRWVSASDSHFSLAVKELVNSYGAFPRYAS